MAKIHPGATLTPHFRDFLPGWVARQPWYAGSGVPSLTAVGYFRFEDPAGQVGIETHLMTDGSVLYQLPLTYRDAPLEGHSSGQPEPLIATAEHSVLGTRWIYDAVADPVWRSELLRLINTGAVSDPAPSRKGVAPAQARGHRLMQGALTGDATTIELIRQIAPGPPIDQPDLVGLVEGTWHPGGPGTPAVTGCLTLARQATEPPPAGR
jgi:Maltokinase N-terminal cap domain